MVARTEAYAKLAREERDKVRGLLPGYDPLVAIAASSTARPVSLPARRTFVGPWAETSNVVTDGDDWEFDDNSYDICAGIVTCPFLLNIASAATRVPHTSAPARVRGGRPPSSRGTPRSGGPAGRVR